MEISDGDAISVLKSWKKNKQICTVKFQNFLGRSYGAPPQTPSPLALRASVPRSGPSALHRPSLCVVDILRYFRPCRLQYVLVEILPSEF